VASVRVIGGDLPKGNGDYMFGQLTLKTGFGQLFGEHFEDQLVDVQVITDENRKSWSDALGLGALSSLAFGPAGWMAGLVLGGNRRETSFVGRLADGRRFVAKTKPSVVQKLAAIALRNAAQLNEQSGPSIPLDHDDLVALNGEADDGSVRTPTSQHDYIADLYDDDDTKRFRVIGVDRDSGMDTELVVEAMTEANAQAKAELKGVVVTDVRAVT